MSETDGPDSSINTEEKSPEIEQVNEMLGKSEEAEVGEDGMLPPVDIYELLAALPDAPSKDQVDFYKTQNGGVASIFSEEEIYIWRPINWAEYKMLQQAAAENAHNPHYLDEQVVYKCVLWPKIKPETLPAMKGGTIPTLSQQIMEGSNFVPPNMAMSLVIKL